MTNLTSRITAALDEQQRLAEDVSARLNFAFMVHQWGGPNTYAGRLATLADPSSVLRRVAAQRRVLERHTPGEQERPDDPIECKGCTHQHVDLPGPCWADWPCPEILDLADALGVGVDVTGVEP